MKDLRIIYMGTPEFAVPGLQKLVINGYNIISVITAPDKPQGRGLKPAFSALKIAAIELGIPVLQPEKLKDPAFVEELRKLRADLQIVVAFRMLPEMVWAMPPLGTFNLHASLLPKYRGAAPINWAIINGETETGVTTFFLQHEIDTGDLILQEKEPIFATDSVGTLYERLMNKGADLIVKTVNLIENNALKPLPQGNPSNLKTAPKIFKENCEIDWTKNTTEIDCFVRGLSPYPSAFTYINGVYTKIFEVLKIEEMGLKPFEFKTDAKTYLYVGTGDGSISIIQIQVEGKRKNGHP